MSDKYDIKSNNEENNKVMKEIKKDSYFAKR